MTDTPITPEDIKAKRFTAKEKQTLVAIAQAALNSAQADYTKANDDATVLQAQYDEQQARIDLGA